MTNVAKNSSDSKDPNDPKKGRRVIFNARISFYARVPRCIDPGSERKIYCRIFYNGECVEFYTGIKVLASAFIDGKISQLNNTYIEYQKSLFAIELEVLKIQNELKLNYSPISAKIIRGILRNQNKEERKLIRTWLEFIERKRLDLQIGQIGKTSFERYSLWKNECVEFLRFVYGVEDIPLDKITTAFADSFLNYLKSRKKFGHDYATRRVDCIRRVLDYAISKEYFFKANILRSVIFKRERKSRLYFLTMDQVRKLSYLNIEDEQLAIVRDAFIFMCFTGLSYVDLLNLSDENIHKDDEGKFWLKVVRQKTKTVATVPLLEEARQLILHYRNFKPRKNYVLVNKYGLIPMYHNAKMNKILKTLGLLAGIETKLMCCHTARKTFSTCALNSGKVSIETVSKMLGHSRIETTQKFYAQVSTIKIQNEMKDFSFLTPKNQ